MDRTETVENLKKEMFRIDFKLKAKQYNNSSEHRELLDRKRKILETLKTLEEEISKSDGQIGFAFTDLIETENIGKRK